MTGKCTNSFQQGLLLPNLDIVLDKRNYDKINLNGNHDVIGVKSRYFKKKP